MRFYGDGSKGLHYMRLYGDAGIPIVAVNNLSVQAEWWDYLLLRICGP